MRTAAAAASGATATSMAALSGSTAANMATLDGSTAATDYAAGTFFDVAGHSGFTIEVPSGICEYICSFL
jgi:uncharacterized protein YaiE (UPF0345 family)